MSVLHLVLHPKHADYSISTCRETEPDCWSYAWELMGSFKLPTPSPVYIILLLRVTGPTSNLSLPTCRRCWVNWEQFWDVSCPRKKGGWGASIAESGPGWRNLWVTLKSMKVSPCMDDESLLLTTAEGLWEEKKKAQTGGRVSLL